MNTKKLMDITDDILQTMERSGYSKSTINYTRSIYKKLNIYLKDEFSYDKAEKIFSTYYFTTDKVVYRSQRRCLKYIEYYIMNQDFLNIQYSYKDTVQYNFLLEDKKEDIEQYFKYCSKDIVTSILRYSNLFLNYSKIIDISELKNEHIYEYLSYVSSNYSLNSVGTITYYIKSFIKYLYNNKYINIHPDKAIPKIKNYKNSSELNYLSKEELKELLKSIDRSNLKGKRDYAIIILAATYGLRSVDITNLKPTQILWKKDIIVLTQKKTNKEIYLPLIKNVKLALLDYYQSNYEKINAIQYMFVTVVPPYKNITRTTAYSIAKFYMKNLDFNTQKNGLHILRHTLAKTMLDEQIPLTVIKDTLGHQSIESTKIYLSIDTTQLKKLSLEVPNE